MKTEALPTLNFSAAC